MRQFVYIVLMLALAGSVFGVDLQPTPIKQAMEAELALFSADDEFGSANQPQNDIDEPREESSLHKSTWKAAALSALLPGTGQHYNGKKKKARFFWGAEALIWISYASFKVYSDWKEDDYINLAAARANARLDGRDDEFHDVVGFYYDIDDYNTIGRIIEPERPYLADTPENHWRWQTLSDRSTYRELKNASREADRRAEFMIGLAIVNRIISVVDAVRDSRRINREIDTFYGKKKTQFKFAINPFSSRNQVKFTILTDF